MEDVALRQKSFQELDKERISLGELSLLFFSRIRELENSPIQGIDKK
jgi:hypothetical protein